MAAEARPAVRCSEAGGSGVRIEFRRNVWREPGAVATGRVFGPPASADEARFEEPRTAGFHGGRGERQPAARSTGLRLIPRQPRRAIEVRSEPGAHPRRGER